MRALAAVCTAWALVLLAIAAAPLWQPAPARVVTVERTRYLPVGWTGRAETPVAAFGDATPPPLRPPWIVEYPCSPVHCEEVAPVWLGLVP